MAGLCCSLSPLCAPSHQPTHFDAVFLCSEFLDLVAEIEAATNRKFGDRTIRRAKDHVVKAGLGKKIAKLVSWLGAAVGAVHAASCLHLHAQRCVAAALHHACTAERSLDT